MGKLIKYLVALVFIFSFFSCEKAETDIGLDLQGSLGKLNVKKEVYSDIRAFTFFDDSLYTSQLAGIIGTYRDDKFGKLDASVYTQLSLSDANLDLSNMHLDSLVLVLQIDRLYPGVNVNETYPAEVTFQVHQLAEPIIKDKSYYSFDSLSVLSSPIFEGTVWLRPDSIELDGKKLAPQVRIRVSDEFMNSLKRKFTSNEEFVEYVKGLCIRMDAKDWKGKGVLASFVFSSTKATSMLLYYRNPNLSDQAKVYRFLLGEQSSKFSRFKQDYSGTALSLFTTNPKDSLPGDKELFMQTLGGTLVKLNFPTLMEWGSKHAGGVINEADLILPVSQDNPDKELPPQLVILAVTMNGELTPILDIDSSFVYFDGKYDPTSKEYRMRVTRHIQNILNGTIGDWGLVVMINERKSTPNRCVIDPKNLRLELVYSE